MAVHTPNPDAAHPAIYTRTLVGMFAHATTVECHIGQGLPSTTIVGLAEGAVREARDRVRAALINSGFVYPDGRLVINLAPGTLTKSSPALDLPIALSILAASRQIPDTHLSSYEFIGELGLFGELRSVHGALPCALASREHERILVIPNANANEAAIAPQGSIVLAHHLTEITRTLSAVDASFLQQPSNPAVVAERHSKVPTFDQIIGQQAAKRAMAIAAAGGHHLLMVGPPGTGKTMLARAFADLLGALSDAEALEVAAVYSAAGLTRAHYREVPFRDPHHSASASALFGGGSPPVPGEVTLAHRGVLFLDELPHFKPSALNLLREPIETGQAVISRARYKVTFPCRFQLLAAMNPCPAGRVCSELACRCSATQVQRYQSRISGPLLDRIDIHVRVPPLPDDLLVALQAKTAKQPTGEALQSSSRTVKAQIAQAKSLQQQRGRGANASLAGSALQRHMQGADVEPNFLKRAVEHYRLSARSYHKVWRVARTIADLQGSAQIRLEHVTEALGYRALDWEAGV